MRPSTRLISCASVRRTLSYRSSSSRTTDSMITSLTPRWYVTYLDSATLMNDVRWSSHGLLCP